MEKIDVTVIIVTWNVEDVIKNCLDSLFKYNVLNIEVIVVDNASTDMTCDIVGKYSNVELIETGENLGFSKANNIGVNKAKGKYILFLNPDTVFIENVLSSLVNYMECHIECGIVAPMLLNANKTLQVSYANYNKPFNLFIEEIGISRLLPLTIKEKLFQRSAKLTYKNVFCVDWVMGAAMLLRTTECKLVGGFSQDYFMYGEDTDLCKKIKNVIGKKTYYYTGVKLVHLGGVSEAKNDNKYKYQVSMQSTLLFEKKYEGEKRAKQLQMVLKNAYKIKQIEFNIAYYLTKKNKFKFKANSYSQLSSIVKKIDLSEIG